MRWPTVRQVVSFLSISLVATVLVSPAAGAALSQSEFEACLLDLINDDRAASGVAGLEMAYDLTDQVRGFSETLSDEGLPLRHMYTWERNPILPDGTLKYRENVGWHSLPDLPDCSAIHTMFMNSPPHRENILSSDVRFVALGLYFGSNGTWVTELFFNSTSYEPPGARGDGLFWDDDGSVFEVEIEKLAAAGITSGCNPPVNDRFCPNDYLTRGQMAAMMVRALGLTETNGTDFTDDDDSVFEPDIEKLAAAGITLGCNPPANTRFCPDEHLTRGQMAAMIVRALDLSDSSGVEFHDDNSCVFESDIEKLATAGITLGCNPPGNTGFCPFAKVTRGQMAAFLVRALDL